MNRLFINLFPIIASVVILFLHILGYAATLYLSNYLVFLIWLLSACIHIILILKLGKVTRFFHKSMYIDTLTQLNNRNFFNMNITNAMESLQKKQTYVSLLIIDLDNFKDINDTYGHIAGDEILKQLSHILKNNIRTTDIAARWGGDEFVITLHGVNGKDAFNVADRIRRIIHNHYFYYNGTSFKVTASIGIASIGDKMDINTFIDLADKALYKAKINKNSVAFLDVCFDL
ncbi:GGDEF domain-containing protein [Clostridium magnum]|uniref:Diguanylate cyclase DosC n=1 Tax=Clostridium magnum DSM 2767 TaxID=1121326 RepID=A0A162TGF1_9CLOT|nr:GGDEF domain-containing protein [Clostridium magnum]KZL92607.1 diguanylate cyclase DosC [Clostridium magnum DSM 2767]SHJ06641.1 diguanylate cyclase (GGDEF) domain-containing protein [Clostridium magnum DSM 2767]